MKPFLLFVFLGLTTLLAAQTSDIKWFDENWNAVPSKSGASYYRISAKDPATNHYVVSDYYASGKLYKTGTYIELLPEIRDGKFTWYFTNGRIQKEAVYEGNKVVSHAVYKKNGDKELSVLLKFVSQTGEEMLEPVKVDKQPSFVGGKKALATYERKNLKYPPITTTEPIEGYVYVLFIVKTDGTLTDVQIAKSLHPDVDNESIRYVTSMPKWNPAMVGETPVEIPFVLPIFFKNKSAQGYTRNNLDEYNR
jgi:TonB family protein